MTAPDTASRLATEERNEISEQLRPGYLFVLPWELSFPGGVNVAVNNLIREFDASGKAAPFAMVLRWEVAQRGPVNEDDPRILHMYVRAPYYGLRPLREALLFLVTAPLHLYRLKRELDARNIKVVNVHYPGLNAWSFVLLKKLGLFSGRLVFSLHGGDFQSGAALRGWGAWLWKKLLESADRIVACSNSFAGDIRRAVPAVSDRTRVVYNGVSQEAVTRELAEKPQGGATDVGSGFILNVSGFEHKKGLDILVHAFAKIASRVPAHRLVIIARYGPALDSIRSLVDTLGLNDRCDLHVSLPHEDVLRFLRRAELFVLPSRMESFGISILEAAVFEVPVIATRVGGIPEIVVSDEFGCLVESEDVDALANAIERSISSSADSRRRAANLRERVLAEFTWRTAADAYLSLMNDSLHERDPNSRKTSGATS